MLTVSALSKSYDGRPALRDVSLEVEEGALVAVLGPSGCGKTTLLRCVAGLERPDSGRIELGEQTAFAAGDGVDLAPDRRGIGFVFQDLALWPHLTVMQHLLFVLGDRFDRATGRGRAAELLDELRVGHLASKKPSKLSGGEAQRVALARALVTEPRLLLLDEPLASLDPGVSAEIRLMLRDLNRDRGTTMLYVTHNREEALQLGDSLVLMKDGSIVQSGSPPEVYRSPASAFAAAFLGPCTFVDGEVTSAGTLDTPLGSFPLDAAARAMRRPRLVLRDHQVRVGADGPVATVRTCDFLGEEFRVVAGLGDVEIVGRASMPWREGDSVHLVINGDPGYIEGDES